MGTAQIATFGKDVAHATDATAVADDATAERLALEVPVRRADLDPVAAGTLVAKEARRRVEARHQEIDAAVLVEIGGDQRARDRELGAERPRLRAGIDEVTVAILPQQTGLGVVVPEGSRNRQQRSRPSLDASVHLREVEVAVVVVVEERGAETGEVETRGAEADGRRGVLEAVGALVAEQRVGLADQMGDEEIEIAVVVDVAGDHAHPRLGQPVQVVGRTQHHRVVDERAVALVDPEVVGIGVVGDVDVEPAVVVEVGGHDAETGVLDAGDAGTAAHVLEATVSGVAVEEVVDAGERGRTAVLVPAALVGALAIGIERDVAGHVQIEQAVAVVVEERGRRRPRRTELSRRSR